MKIIANECIFDQGDFSCHASHFALLPDGGVFAVWFRGSAEGAGDVCIWGARRTPGGKWGAARRLTADDGVPHWNPVLQLTDDGALLLYYKAGYPIAEWHTEIMVSSDFGESFGVSRELVPGDISGGRGPVRNKVLMTSRGDWLAPASREYTNAEWNCFIDRSADGGKTWKRSNTLRLPEKYTRNAPQGEACGIIQPTLWEDDGGIHALMRSTVGFVFRSDSTDGGATFSEPYATDIPNNNSGIDLCTLPGGEIILACNPVGLPAASAENITEGADTGNSSAGNGAAGNGAAGGTKKRIWGKRTPLSLLISHDGGVSFSEYTRVATGKGVFAYPAIAYRDGKLWLTYTQNRKTIMFFVIGL